MRAFIATAGGAGLIIVLFTLAVLFYLPPARAGEGWRCGSASWYGRESCVSDPCLTRSGEVFTGNDYTAAMIGSKHIGERYRVYFGHKSVVVRINDMGGFAKYGRIIDLSKRVAIELGLIGQGTGTVCLERLLRE